MVERTSEPAPSSSIQTTESCPGGRPVLADEDGADDDESDEEGTEDESDGSSDSQPSETDGDGEVLSGSKLLGCKKCNFAPTGCASCKK